MNESAVDRVPWIGARWDLLDLQVLLRGGLVQGTLLENGTLRLREGDSFRLAVFFVNGLDQVVDPAPSQVRFSIRAANNVDELLTMALQPAVAQSEEGMPYFLFEPNVARLGGAATELMDGQNELRCVADVDWTVGGKIYSSASFPVLFEFGLTTQEEVKNITTRPTTPTKPTTPTTPTTPTNPTTPTTPTPPQPPPLPPSPPGLDEGAIRALFDQWLLEVLPVEEGFLYVRNGEITDAVPGTDCSTGEQWTP
jgi:hypothetical protein